MQNRICGESSKLISSLDPDTRYIKFVKWSDTTFTAVICSQIDDTELSDVFTGDFELWAFDDISKAVRSLRRLNKDVQIYTRTHEIELSK